MEALKLMIPKSDVKYLYDISNFAEGLGLLRSSGYTSIPVIQRDGTYAGVVSDKDFLNVYMDSKSDSFSNRLRIKDIMQPERGRPINVNSNIDDVLLSSMEQNFVSVVDDLNHFIGIITRREIIRFLKEQGDFSGFVEDTYRIVENSAGNASRMQLALNNIEKQAAQMEMFFTMYEAGMKEICIRLETINELLSYKYNREPLQQMESRIKDTKSILGKLARKNLPPTMDAIRTNLFDIAGVRVICSYVDDVYEIARYLSEQKDLNILAEKDYIKNPKPNGYRSLHLIITVPVYFLEATQLVPVEIQLRTKPMDYWASLEHDLKYKPVQNFADIDISSQLLEISEQLDNVEEKMQQLAALLERK